MVFSRDHKPTWCRTLVQAFAPLAVTALMTGPLVSQEVQFQQLPASRTQPGTVGSPAVVSAQGGTATATGGVVRPVNFEALSASTPNFVHRLQFRPCAEFEQALVESWLHQPLAQVTDEGRRVLVQIPTAGSPSMMTIDRVTGTISVHASAEVAAGCQTIIQALDRDPQNGQPAVLRVATLARGETGLVEAVAQSYGAVIARRPQDWLVSTAASPTPNASGAAPAALTPRSSQDGVQLPGGQDIDPETRLITRTTDEQGQTLTGPVRIQVFPELDAIVIYGPPDDVERLKKTINEIMETAKATSPKYERVPLEGADPQTVADAVQGIYDDIYSANLGTATIRPIQDPRGLLLIGREEAINVLKSLIKEYDVPMVDTEPLAPNFKAFRLQYISAADFKTRVDLYFSQFPNSGLQVGGTPIPVITIADFRSNTLIVKGSKANFEQVELLRQELDVDSSAAVNMVRVFQLKNTLADQIAISLQDALNGQQQNAGRGFSGGQNFAQQQNQQFFGQQNQAGSQLRSPALQMMTVDRNGQKVSGGIMFDVRVTANSANNSLVVSAPEAAMGLIESLVDQMDTVPTVETQIKVFQIINGDAQVLLTMLQNLFGGQAGQQAGGFGGAGGLGGFGGAGIGGAGQTLQLPAQSASASAGITLANLRFGIDQRTNSIVVTGPIGDLMVIEDLLTRLDEQEMARRQVAVLRLSNAPVADVAETVQGWLDSRQTNIFQADPGFTNAKVQSQRFVIVQPEVVSNQLIVYALPEYLEEVVRVIRHLDRRPPMLKIKVLIAEVNLSMLEQLGVDIGLQDSLLFDRGIGNIGFPFNQSGIGNNADAASLATRGNLAGQALSNLGTGRINSDLGYGGLVLSAGSESVNILLRALQDKQCARILDKPHIMTIENQQGRFQSGATVARISGVTTTNFGVTNEIQDTDVGIILEVTPRISQDGMIVMKVNAVKSSLGEEADGVPVFVNATGQVIRSPNINKIELSSTVMARSGQTVVLSGLISETKTKLQRGVPLLSNLPLVGPLFRFESERDSRNELMIIMTPMLVDSEEDLDAINWDEQDRMHWCLQDVAEIYGTTHFDPNPVYQSPPAYYPAVDPLGVNPEITAPAPAPTPTFQGTMSTPRGTPGVSPEAAAATAVARTSVPDSRGAAVAVSGLPPRTPQGVAERNSAAPESFPQTPAATLSPAPTGRTQPVSFRQELGGKSGVSVPASADGKGFPNYLPQDLENRPASVPGSETSVSPGYTRNPFTNNQ